MCGLANLQQIEDELKRRANRRPVHWGWQVTMLACAALCIYLYMTIAGNWLAERVQAQAAACQPAPAVVWTYLENDPGLPPQRLDGSWRTLHYRGIPVREATPELTMMERR